MKEQLIIFPYNGNALEALDCIDESRYELLGFIDDDPQKRNKASGAKIWERDVLQQYPAARVLAVPGSPVTYKHRAAAIASLGIPEERFVSIIHPSTKIGKDVRIGTNCLIMAGVVLTSNAVIGDHVCILPNTVVHHDAVVGDYSLIGSNVTIAGGVTIQRNCYIGSGTGVRNGLTIGAGALVGLGSVVVRDVAPGDTVAGNPARIFKKQ